MAHERVLVVDDDPSYLERVSAIAVSCGLDPMQASGLGPATRLLNDETFALVITDNHMPSADQGIELLQFMDRRLATKIPAILHSSVRPRNLEMVLEVFPWARFVLKGDDSGPLRDAIREMLPE